MKHQKVLTKFLNPNDWQPGRYQSKCDQPRPRSLLKLFKRQNGLFHTTFFLFLDSSERFHSDFCGCFQRRSTLILYMHFFFYFSPSCPEHKMYSRVTDSVGVVSALCSVAHFFFFFHVPTCSLSKIGRAVLDRNSPAFKYIQCILDSFLTYISRSSFFLSSACNFTVCVLFMHWHDISVIVWYQYLWVCLNDSK